MFIVMGATGHVGSAVADTLLAEGRSLTVVTRDEEKAAGWRRRGAEAAVADIEDVETLRAVFRRGCRAFLLNPPAPPSTDTDARERATARAIVAALDGSGLEKLVVESTYGAQPGDRIGDLSVLHDLEQALAAQPIPTTVLRAAYYMSNWDALLDAAREGSLPTFFPADFRLPMVAPADLGRAAARLLQTDIGDTGIHYVEGPARYSARDVADAFSRALKRPVRPVVVPRDKWTATYRELGFSAEAAASYTRMTEVTLEQGFALPAEPERGTITIDAYVAELVRREAAD